MAVVVGGGHSIEGRGYRRVRGSPRVSLGGDARSGAGGRGRAAPDALPAWETLETMRPGQSWGAGGRGGRSPAPLPPSLDKWAAGRRRAGGRTAAACGRERPARPRPRPPPHPPFPAGGAAPGSAARKRPRPPRGWGGGSGFSSLPGAAWRAGGGRAGQGAGPRCREGGRGSPVRLMLALPPRSRLSPGSGRLVAAIGTQGGGPGLLSPSLPPRRAALEDFLPLRPPRCPPDMVGHLQLQGMDESLKEKSREGLLDSPDSGLPPSPSPPFYSLSPGEGRAGGSGGADPPAPGHRREAKDGKVVRAKPGR